MTLTERLTAIPEGYTTVFYNGRAYGLSKSSFNQGKSVKVYAEELGGNDFISLNFYLTGKGEQLRPCEMPAEKVLHFLYHYKPME